MVLLTELNEVAADSKVLLVGAGGIGCEVLKNLALTGFKDIVIIDLDTIDVSNLNRQFLFRKEHVGKPKALVAKNSIDDFLPNLNIAAYHDNIFSEQYGLNFFKKFSIVINALDNRAARNHVNRMCLAADVPLIESGTSGYSGQVELIRKGITQCYECQPKPVNQKSFPGCTIRNTPSEPVHCIVWAKHLFNQLFGEEDADQDVSPDTEDPELRKNGEFTETDTGNVNRLSTRQWAHSTNYDPEKLFNKFFNDDIEYLRSMDQLWKKRTPPSKLSWSEALEMLDGQQDEPAEVGRSKNMELWSIAMCAKVFAATVSELKDHLTEKGILYWDKDDRSGMDFVTACANIRSFVFSIAQKSGFEIKSIAGNIIPAIATANAIIAGLVVTFACRVLLKQYENCKTVYLREKSQHSNTILAADRNTIPPNPNCYVCASVPTVDVFVNIKSMTVKQFEGDVLKGALNMIAPDVVIDGKGVVVISSEEGETTANNNKLLCDVGIVDGCILRVDDFHQNYELTVNISHYEAKDKDDPPFKFIPHNSADMREKADPTASENHEMETNGHSSTTEITNGNKVNQEQNGDNTEEVFIVENPPDEVDPGEGPSKRRRLISPQVDDDDDDLIMLDDD